MRRNRAFSGLHVFLVHARQGGDQRLQICHRKRLVLDGGDSSDGLPASLDGICRALFANAIHQPAEVLGGLVADTRDVVPAWPRLT